MKQRLYFTLDYEIHGNGDGNPYELMVEPTYRLMNLLERYHQRLTIMADVAEILCFKRYWEITGKDDFHVQAIEKQLKQAIKRGHDVQLHIHSSYFKSQWNGKRFDQCIEEYNLAALPYERISEMVATCIDYLETLLRPIHPDYRVWLFRAANWSMMPTPTLYRVLMEQGITHDTSVYKGGCQGGNVCYDYRTAHDNLFAYPASLENINQYDLQGALVEMPIYTEQRPFYDFLSPMRIFRMLRARMHRHKKNHSPLPTSISNTTSTSNTTSISVTSSTSSGQVVDNRRLTLRSFFVKSPMKMDFNQVSSRQLIRMMRHIEQRIRTLTEEPITIQGELPIVLIGHSKTFIPYNEKTLLPFLEWLQKHGY